MIEPPSVSDPIKLLVTNKVSFAVSYIPALYAARDKGIPVKGIAALQRNLSASLYWLPDSKISSVADLKGKTIALTAKLDERAYVKALLASAGLTMKDVKTVNPGFASSRLLIDKKVDATHGVVTNPASVAGLGGPKSLKSFKYRDHGVPNYPWLVISSTDSFLAKNPAATCRFLRAVSRGADVAVGRRSKTQALANTINEMNPSYSIKTLVHHARLMAPDFHDENGRFGTLVIQDWESARGWMVDNGIIRQRQSDDFAASHPPSSVLIKVKFPAAVPFIFAGFKNAVVFAVIGALVAEWVGATGGLGPVIITALGVFETPLVFAAILYIVAMSITLFVITTVIERGVNLWLYGRPD